MLVIGDSCGICGGGWILCVRAEPEESAHCGVLEDCGEEILFEVA